MTTSPDLREYTDLVLYDRTPAELVERALLDAVVKLPGWVPREGNTEVVLIEALSLEVAELVFAINRLPGAVTEVLLQLVGLERSEGNAATATATFAVATAAGYTIPVGTTVRLDLVDESVEFTTDVDLIIPAASTSGTVAVTAATPGSAPNGTPAGTLLTLTDSVAYVDTVVLATAVAGGSDLEDTGAWLNRGAERLSRLTDALVLPDHFTAAALEDTRVGRATTLDNTDATAAAPGGDDPGHVTVVVADASGAALGGAMAEIEADLEARSSAMLQVHVIAPTVTPVDVTATVVRKPGHDSATVQADIVAALDTYLSPATWEWSATVRRNELIALLDGVTGVDYVATLTVPAADVALTGYGPLADLGTATITVDAP